MKKLIITILAIATMALAANKPVCYLDAERSDSDPRLFFNCTGSSTETKTVIVINKDFTGIIVEHTFIDGSRKFIELHHGNIGYPEEYIGMSIYEFDEFGIIVKHKYVTDTRHSMEYYYKALREKYDLRKI